MTADNGEGRPRQAAPADRIASKLTDTPKVPRTTWNGHPGLSVGHDRYIRNRRGPEPAAVDPTGVAVLEGELAELLGGLPTRSTAWALTDTERIAEVLAGTFGPTWARRLAAELEAVADDLAPNRTPWGGGDR